MHAEGKSRQLIKKCTHVLCFEGSLLVYARLSEPGESDLMSSVEGPETTTEFCEGALVNYMLLGLSPTTPTEWVVVMLAPDVEIGCTCPAWHLLSRAHAWHGRSNPGR